MLLAHHPDKNQGQRAKSEGQMDFALLKLAYETLSSPERRRQYDAEAAVRARGQRPAEVVSLDEWEEVVEGEWRHPCRCGRAYVLREADLERGVHLVGCEGCSEVVWAGYALAADDE